MSILKLPIKNVEKGKKQKELPVSWRKADILNTAFKAAFSLVVNY